MQHRQRRQDVGDVVTTSLLEQGDRVPQPRLESSDPACVDLETDARATYPAEQVFVRDGEGIGLRLVQETHRPLVIAELLLGDDRLASQHHSTRATRAGGLGDEPVHPTIDRGPLPDAVPGLEQPVDEVETELGLRGRECVFDSDDVQRVVLTDLDLDPPWRELVASNDRQLVDGMHEEPVEHLAALIVGERLLSNGSDRRQQAVASRPGAVLGDGERVVDQGRQRLRGVRRDGRRRRQPEAAGQHGEST